MRVPLNRNDISAPLNPIINIEHHNGVELWEVPSKAPTMYLTHNYFRYIGKFPPQIPHKFIEDYGVPNGLVVDPMCGGGTTLIEATRLGMNAVGSDINPVARLISRVATTTVSPNKLKEIYTDLDELLTHLELSSLPLTRIKNPVVGLKTKPRDLQGMDHYFTQESLNQLLILQEAISAQEDPKIQDFFQLALMSILRHVSKANVKKMNTEIDENKTIKPVVSTFRDQVRSMLEVNQLAYDTGFPFGRATIIEGQAQNVEVADSSADLVILHPPYLSGTAFSESVQLQLAWSEFNHKTLRKIELAMRGSYFHVTNGLRKYLVGWSRILGEAYRMLKPGGVCASVIGDGKVEYVRIPMGAITREFGEDHGFETIREAKHLLNHNTGKTLNKKMKAQDIVVFRKTT